MRRLGFAAVVGCVGLAACSDSNRPTAPSESPSFSTTSTCSAGQLFPGGLSAFQALLPGVFESNTVNPASNKASAISSLMAQGKQSNALKQAFQFIAWTLERDQQRKVISQSNESAMIKQLLCAVGSSGLPGQIDDPTDPNVGVGYYDPKSTQPTVVTTNNGIAGTQIPPGSLRDPNTGQPITVPALISIVRMPDSPQPLNTNFPQFAPFFFYDASYETCSQVENTQVCNSNSPTIDPPATVAYCQSTSNPPPASANIRIGHNKNDTGFEILPQSTVPFPLNCANVGSFNLGSATGFNVQNLALNAWRSLGSFAQAMLLPEPAYAFWFGTIGGKTTSFSPFGSVDATEWTYLQVASGTAPAGWQTLSVPASAPWQTGFAPFGLQTSCALPVTTPWAENTDMLLRRDVLVPTGVTSATISVLVDNDIQVWVNGIDVSGGSQVHGGCANTEPPGPFTVGVGTGQPFVPGQVAKIAVLGHDYGDQTYLDVKIKFNP